MTTQPMTTLEVLYAAWALVDTPEKWCKHAVKIGDAYCIVGACYYANPRGQWWHALAALSRIIGHESPERWNNAEERTHADIMALFARAVRAEQERQHPAVTEGMGDIAGLGVANA